MSSFKRILMWIALFLVVLLTGMSVYTAFIGAERAKAFFNSIPLSVYWVGFAITLSAGLVVFRRLIRVPGLLLIHGGCILILAGAMAGSKTGHRLQSKMFGVDKIQTGQMVLFEGVGDNRAVFQTEQGVREIKELPFTVKLKDFRLEYYQPEYLWVYGPGGLSRRIPVKLGMEFDLGPGLGKVTILRRFENFKYIINRNGKGEIVDDPGPGLNAALEVKVTDPNGKETTRYVFERFGSHITGQEELQMTYHRVVRDYISDVEVIRNGKVVATKSIEVNHPMHFDGYYFYQYSYDAQNGEYTVLMVASDTGLWLVYAGYAALCAGLVWHMWVRRAAAWCKLKRR